jgi:hypothetical protein
MANTFQNLTPPPDRFAFTCSVRFYWPGLDEREQSQPPGSRGWT